MRGWWKILSVAKPGLDMTSSNPRSLPRKKHTNTTAAYRREEQWPMID